MSKLAFFQKKEQVGIITLNRPDKLNAINDELFSDLEAALEEARLDTDIICVVIKGAGSSFSVGQDLSSQGTARVMPPNPHEKAYLSDIFEQDMRNYTRWRAIWDFPKFTIAQVHGYCLGAGCELAMCCRTAIAAEDAVFGDPSIRIGLAPSNPLWTWRIGLRKTRELLLTGQYIDGKEAERIGLVMRAVPKDKLDEVVANEAEINVRDGVATLEGIDGRVAEFAKHQVTLDQAGLAAAWRFASFMHSLSATQRPGRSIIERGGFDFYAIRDKEGLKAAIAKRDDPFKPFFPAPRTGGER